mmetsp:Transcript_48148/g.92030  ORF Transcript_48148/g.92030 Transcript_48148/m.92030 type:complete len:492 (+) Transcript_48148:682-2157(+)
MLNNTGTVVGAGLCALIACSTALYEMYNHIRHYNHPTFQRYILRLIFMVPVYSFSSWLSLAQRKNQLYFDTIRDCYEAWVIYNFLSLCMAYVGGPGQVVVHMEGHSVKGSWRLGTACFPTMPINGLFLRRCKQGALQFVMIKPVLAVLTLVLASKGLYGADELRSDKGFVWILAIYNASYTVALYSLLFFYLGAKELLKPFNPVIKFLIVKAVVFLTFWQGMMISFMVMSGAISTSEDAKALQNLLTCVEMVPAAVMMLFAFPHTDYRTPVGLTRVANAGLRSKLGHAISIHDVVSDTVHQFAPTYQDYVLYSDGTTGSGSSVSRHRTRTFVMMGQEMTNAMSKSPIRTDGIDCSPLNLGPLVLDQVPEEDSSPTAPPLSSPGSHSTGPTAQAMIRDQADNTVDYPASRPSSRNARTEVEHPIVSSSSPAVTSEAHKPQAMQPPITPQQQSTPSSGTSAIKHTSQAAVLSSPESSIECLDDDDVTVLVDLR